ncbi:MAG: recombinase family protein [Chloroflexi bacterium]|uniref:Recombinase family protein n=1 Tax=Candidatus Chlorohelix allophototropha TaxID=3003348 RepID=A0A8T7MAJ1_9CHLR|nr:recombinase family protein [Chloroflexota bacterium]NWJ49180.1 recombinase family protein [Chloroflexota bacterium]WJW67578.1 recombinase family protein [Chloroflexota bacterium L227-S17]
MTDSTKLALATGQSKLTLQHCQRLAYVYVRQSTAKQVERNRESQENQYHLVERAKMLGWSTERIRIIDMDQAQTASSSSHRAGFKDLVAEVSLGLVGIIFGWEVSRLARNNSDWYHLLDLAALFKTLIADNDGIYDPRLYNDRLLLGLKGTMSEAELYLIRQRMDAGRLNQVHKGTYRQCLPTGLVRLPDGTVVKDPDDSIRHTIELVFNQFAEKGSSWKVAKALKQAGVLLPRCQTGGFFRGQLLWKPVTEAAVYKILNNPGYAGAFVYGRRPTDPFRKQITGRPIQVHKPMEEWINIQQNVIQLISAGNNTCPIKRNSGRMPQILGGQPQALRELADKARHYCKVYWCVGSVVLECG